MSTAVNKMSGTGEGNGSAQQQLEFTQAMADFRSMFPTMDADVIETVLRANRGAVDATIDHLLLISADSEQELSHNVAAASKMAPPTYEQAVDQQRDLIDWSTDEADANNAVNRRIESETSKPNVDLLSDELAALSSFGAAAAAAEPAPAEPAPSLVPTQQMLQERYELNLKLTEEAKPQLLTLDDEEESKLRIQQQLLEDERLALMMQNQEFMAELRRDPDFLSTLDEELQQQQSSTSPRAAATTSAERRTRVSSLLANMDDNQFREKLRNMGKKSKKRFAQMASVFSRRNNGRQFANNDRELLNDQPILPDDDDEDEEELRPRQSSGSRWNNRGGKYTSFH